MFRMDRSTVAPMLSMLDMKTNSLPWLTSSSRRPELWNDW